MVTLRNSSLQLNLTGIFVFTFLSKLSSFQRVIIGLVLGIFTGLFIGEPAGELSFIGTAYVRLLQMTVLPYLLLSIVGGLGRLNSDTAAKIGIHAGLLVLFLWLATMLTNLLLPLAYPNWESASFFSTSMASQPETLDFLQLYIPSNIFFSLSNAVVPSVVLFCLFLGSALISVKDKSITLGMISNISDALMNMASFVAKLAPYGIFAISASSAGTIEFESLGKLQVFLWGYLGIWALMSFVALPLFISWASPFKYRDINKIAGEAMITAFATGTVLVVLPMIAERCKALLKDYGMDSKESISAIDVLAPTAYSFPSVGTLMGLGFILFSGWYLGSPLTISQYPEYVAMGTLSAFGGMPVAIPFLLEHFNLPSDQFQLYLLGSVVTGRFATAMAALHGFIICVLVASAIMNKLRWKRLLSALAVHLSISAVAMMLLGLLLSTLIDYRYSGDKSFESMELMDPPAKIVTSPMHALSTAEQSQSRLDVILQRGVLRVGYFRDHLPYAYRNNAGEVIGYDIDLVHELARDLGVALELHLIQKSGFETLLNDGRIDLAVGALGIQPNRALKVSFSKPHFYHTLGLVVKDADRDRFSSMESILKQKDLTLALPVTSYYQEAVGNLFDNPNMVTINSPRPFFKGEVSGVDAMAYPVEVAAAWTLLYPNYSVLVPKGLSFKIPAGLAMAKNQPGLTQYINTWLTIKESGGYQQRLYNYWILGKNPKKVVKRWSIAKDVLNWID